MIVDVSSTQIPSHGLGWPEEQVFRHFSQERRAEVLNPRRRSSVYKSADLTTRPCSHQKKFRFPYDITNLWCHKMVWKNADINLDFSFSISSCLLSILFKRLVRFWMFDIRLSIFSFWSLAFPLMMFISDFSCFLNFSFCVVSISSLVNKNIKEKTKTKFSSSKIKILSKTRLLSFSRGGLDN